MRVFGAGTLHALRPGRHPVALALGLAALLLTAGDSVLARTSARVSSGMAAVQPADSRNPAVPPPASYPPPQMVPAGVSICGPLFTSTLRPTCTVGGTVIHGERADLASYALAIVPSAAHRFPNLPRDITLSRRVAGSLFTVLGHAKFDGQLLGTQIIPLSRIQVRLRLQLLGGNLYRIEVDQKTGAADFREIPVGVASFTYTR